MQYASIQRITLAFIALALLSSLLALPAAGPVTAAGNVFFVTPEGSSSGDGSEGNAWDLQTALKQPASVGAGATILVRGGTYRGAFVSQLKGSAAAPIIVRAYPGERAILTNSDKPALDIKGSAYVHFLGLEITAAYDKRKVSRSESNYGVRANQGKPSHHIKFINMIFHDVQAQGIGWWQAMEDSEIYGSLFYNNGTTQLDHGIYANNLNGTKYFVDNIVFDNASHGFHGYIETSEKALNNFVLEGNTFFNNGSTGYTESKGKYGLYKRNILVGGMYPTHNAVIVNNYTYYPGKSGTSLNLGYKSSSSGARVSGNFFMGGEFEIGGSAADLRMNGNTIYAPGGIKGLETSQYGDNQWLAEKPTGLQYFVRPNRYEPNRAHITIYNWHLYETVHIPASALGGIALQPGQSYELRNVQNYFGDVITGTYDGSHLAFPMTGRSVAQPLGLDFKPASSFPEFGAFVLITK